MSESRRRFPPSLYYLFEIEVVFDGSSDSVCVQRPLVVEQGSLSSLSYAFDKLTRTATFGKQNMQNAPCRGVPGTTTTESTDRRHGIGRK